MTSIVNPLAIDLPAIDQEAMNVTRARLDSLTKPPGSLGRLEQLAVQLAGITSRVPHQLPNKTVILMAGDHGVVEAGVSPYPKTVTAQMVANFILGGAAINVLAKAAGARVRIVDMGVATDLDAHPELDDRKIGYGTANIANGAAMSRAETERAIEAGAEIADDEIQGGADLIATGEMGIGNTTSSTAIVAALLGARPSTIVGPGTGLDGDGIARKTSIVERAIAINKPDPSDPIDLLAKLGGFEIAGLTGAILRSAQARRPVLLDGFITGAAALIAHRIRPDLKGYLIASHRSSEPGHSAVLQALGLTPLLDLDLRLGEGSGAALAMPLIDSALAILNDMATFEEAGVSDRNEHD